MFSKCISMQKYLEVLHFNFRSFMLFCRQKADIHDILLVSRTILDQRLLALFWAGLINDRFYRLAWRTCCGKPCQRSLCVSVFIPLGGEIHPNHSMQRSIGGSAMFLLQDTSTRLFNSQKGGAWSCMVPVFVSSLLASFYCVCFQSGC